MFKVFVFLALTLASADASWYTGLLKSGQITLVECRRKTGAFDFKDYHVSLVKMKACVKDVFLGSLDELIDAPDIPINPYVSMKLETNHIDTNETERADPMDELYTEDLTTSVSKRIFKLFDTHTIKLNLYPETEEFEGRRRQHYRRAFPMMVAGFMMMSAFLVPLGFQFMAMIGGKALLLAKMAFFMSMFSGYKRLTNDIEYHHHHQPSAHGGAHDQFLHHLNFHHRSAENPMTLAFSQQQNGLVPIFRKGG